MFAYLETLPQYLENAVIIIFLLLLIAIIIGSGFFVFKIVKKIKDIKLKAAGAEVDIEIESLTDIQEIKQSEGAVK